MNTAMTELIERVEELFYIESLGKWDKIKSECLEKEKQQIIKAHTSGMAAQVKENYAHKKLHPPLTKMNGEEYYNNTFNQ